MNRLRAAIFTCCKTLLRPTLAGACLLAAACAAAPTPAAPPASPEPITASVTAAAPTPAPTDALAVVPAVTQPTAAPTAPFPANPPAAPAPRPPYSAGPDDWKKLPVIPQIGQAPPEIYRRGLELGNNPNAFSKVGDCGATPAWFLGDFDRGTRFYSLGEHADLQAVIDYYHGSFARLSMAGKAGFNTSSVLTSLWADRSQCNPNETPLACEYRLHRPALAFITLGANDVWHPDKFEPQMRRIIEYSIQQGVIPILSTKADNEEKDGSLNAVIARLGYEYDIPVWNYWRAVQDLPDGGLQPDKVHLTWGPNRFDDPKAMQTAWAMRNLNALQILQVLRLALK
jgi:hypothetical protein